MSEERAKQLIEAGIWLKLSGDRAGAINLFERALSLDPSNDKARQLLEGLRNGASPQPEKPFALTQPPKVAPLAQPLPPPMPKTIVLKGALESEKKPAPLLDAYDPLPEFRPMSPAASLLPAPHFTPPLYNRASKAESAWDLVEGESRSPPAPEPNIQEILRGAKSLLDLDDHTGAMELLSKAQDLKPEDPHVAEMRERSERTLLTMFESKLGRLAMKPRVLLKDDEIIWLNLDHRAGFVLAQIDGTVSFDDLFSVSGLSRVDTARILAQLIEEGVISRE